jgi:predicted nuclease with TOPRIM domain
MGKFRDYELEKTQDQAALEHRDTKIQRLESENAKLNERIKVLEDALKKSYRKHWLNDERIGWQELGDIIYNALCISLGDDAFEKWLNEYRKALEVKP